MAAELVSLKDILLDSARFGDDRFLYLPMDESWNLDTRCAVLAESDLDGVPDIASRHGLAYALGMSAVHDLIANAREQMPNANEGRLLEAFFHYYDNDAFISFR